MRDRSRLSGAWPWGDEGRGIVALSVRAPSKGGLVGGGALWVVGLHTEGRSLASCWQSLGIS